MDIDNLEADAPLPDELPVGETSEDNAQDQTEDKAKDEDDADASAEPDTDSTETDEGEGEAEADAEDDASAKETKSQRKRRLRREREQEREREIKRARDEIARLKDELEREKAPEYSQFENPDDYTAERAAWAAEQRIRKQALDQAERTAKQTEESGQEDRVRAVQEVFEEGREAHPDFEEVVKNPNLPLSHDMLGAALEADNTRDVLYFLGKNPDEARRVASLSPVGQAVEIGRLSTRLAQPRKKTSSAPPPIKPVKGSSGRLDKSPADMSYAEYKAWREKNA